MNEEQKAFCSVYIYTMSRITEKDIEEFFEQFPISPEKREVGMASYKWDAIEDAWSVWCSAVEFAKEQTA